MNDGLPINKAYSVAGFEDNLIKASLSVPTNGLCTPISMPYHFSAYPYPFNTDYKNLVLVFDISASTGKTITLQFQSGAATVDWGDGNIVRYNVSAGATVSYTYLNYGTYIVQFIAPSYNQIYNLAGLGSKLIRILSFGNMGTTNLYSSFHTAPNLIEVPQSLPSTVTNMGSMFRYCIKLNDPNLSYWNTTNVTDMSLLFDCFNVPNSTLNQNLGSWDTSKVTTLLAMFRNCTNFNNGNLPDITGWNTSNVTHMGALFFACRNLGANSNRLDFSNWNVNKVTVMSNMFQQCASLNNITISGWSPPSGCSHVSQFATSNLTNSYLPNWTFNGSNDCNNMFQGTILTNVSGLETWNTSGITNMNGMFFQVTQLNLVDPTSWDTSNVTNMANTFASSNFNKNISSWNTSKVTTMATMFSSNGTIGAGGNAMNLSSWDVSKVTSMTSMFSNCTNLRNITISGWSPASGCNHTSQFGSANISGSYLPNWTFKANNNASAMFGSCNMTNVSGLNTWNTSGIINCSTMFQNAVAFNDNLSGWDVSNVTTMNGMFGTNTSPSFMGSGLENWNLARLNVSTALTSFATNQTFPSGQYDLILNSWNTNKASGVNGIADWRTDLSPNFGFSKYTAAGSAARASLVSYGWTITDGGLQT